MKKLLLIVALVLTLVNLTIGITYAAVCQGAGGARACGERCISASDGQCGCTGACTKDERDFVAGAHVAQMEEEELAY